MEREEDQGRGSSGREEDQSWGSSRGGGGSG